MDDLRKGCPMRHENGNCTVIGGFCTAVNDSICEGLHSAYDSGYRAAALRANQERENPKPMTNAQKIRGMSDEELAAWAINEAPKIGFRYTSSEAGLLEWLKQPAEKDD